MSVITKFYNLDTDSTLSNNSDVVIASQKAVKTYVDTNIPATTSSVTSGSTAALTSGGAYTNLVSNVSVHSTDANKIVVTKNGTDTTITIDNVAHASSADSATTATSAGSVAWNDITGTPAVVTHTASTAAGSATQPVYIASDGTATATTYSLAKSVPSDAVFTDTTYSAFTGADGTDAGSAGLVPAPVATDNTKYLKGDGTWSAITVPTITMRVWS